MSWSTEWINAVAAVGSSVAAIVALVVALRVARTQNRIQERQLQQDLFDKRYVIYRTVEEFIADLFRTEGAYDLNGKYFRRFLYAKERAKFLFDDDVVQYLNEVGDVAKKVYPKAKARDHKANMREYVGDESREVVEMLGHAEELLRSRRDAVFTPYLQLHHRR